MKSSCSGNCLAWRGERNRLPKLYCKEKQSRKQFDIVCCCCCCCCCVPGFLLYFPVPACALVDVVMAAINKAFVPDDEFKETSSRRRQDRPTPNNKGTVCHVDIDGIDDSRAPKLSQILATLPGNTVLFYENIRSCPGESSPHMLVVHRQQVRPLFTVWLWDCVT